MDTLPVYADQVDNKVYQYRWALRHPVVKELKESIDDFRPRHRKFASLVQRILLDRGRARAT